MGAAGMTTRGARWTGSAAGLVLAVVVLFILAAAGVDMQGWPTTLLTAACVFAGGMTAQALREHRTHCALCLNGRRETHRDRWTR